MNEYEIRLECLKMAECVAGETVDDMLRAAQSLAGFVLGHGTPSSTSCAAAKPAQYLSNGCRASTPRRDPA